MSINEKACMAGLSCSNFLRRAVWWPLAKGKVCSDVPGLLRDWKRKNNNLNALALACMKEEVLTRREYREFLAQKRSLTELIQSAAKGYMSPDPPQA